MFGKLKKWFLIKMAERKLKDLRGKDKESDMGKVLKFMDGWKLVIFALVTFGARVYDAAHNGHTGDIVGSILNGVGYAPDAGIIDSKAIGAAALGTLAIWGVATRVYNAQKQIRAGSSVAGALTTEGYISAAVADAAGDAKKTKTLDATIAKAELVAEIKAVEESSKP